MRKDIVKDIEKALQLQEEIVNEYNRLREKKADAALNGGKYSPSEYAQFTLLEHLMNFIL